MSEQEVLERAEPLKLAALASHGFLTEEGEILRARVEDVIFDRVAQAEVSKISDRKTVAVTRTALTKHVFPKTPGPGDYQQEDDPDAAEKAWSMLSEIVWRACDTNAGKPIQSRLNGTGGLVLCRTMATSERGVEGVYVTRDWACILADFVKPDQKRVARAINQQTRNAEMGAERLPRHGKKFRRELSAETKSVLDAGVSKVDRMIEAGSDTDDTQESE